MALLDLIDLFLPPEESKALRKYHFRMSMMAVVSFIGLYFIIFPALIMEVPFLGRIARANDIKAERTADIKAAIKPIEETLNTVVANQREYSKVLNDIRVDQLAGKLRDLWALKCKITDDEGKDRIADEINNTQRQYRVLTNERYEFEPCQ